MTKGKNEQKKRSEMIREDIGKLFLQLAASKADIERAEKQKARLIQQEEELAEHFRSDPKAKNRLEILEDEEGKTDREIRRYRREAEKVQKRIARLNEGLEYAERMEAADRILLGYYPVMQAKSERLDVLFEEAAGICEELIAIGRQIMTDANVVHPGHTDMRRFNPSWNLIDALRWRFSMLHPRQAMPDPAFRRPLAELTKEGREAARHTLNRGLRGEQAEDENNQTMSKEVA